MTILQKEMIFSLSSGAGRSGVSVFRLSGEGSYQAALKLSKRKALKPRYAHLSNLLDYEGAIIDEALLLYFPAPHSFTGEDVAEFHCHGSPAVNQAIAKRLSELGARQAEAGEFTRRAVLNGRMDLTEAEGLADLIDSESDMQRRQAIRQMQGGLRDIYSDWKECLLDALAQIEGEIDFPDEADIPDSLSHKAYPILQDIKQNIEDLLQSSNRGLKIREGVSVTLIGAPNSGKSSIINRLARSEIAIVTDKPGTTRDIVTAHIIIAGLAVTLSDTAGLRETQDLIEGEGVKRAKSKAKESDLRLWVVDGSSQTTPKRPSSVRADDVLLVNKSDVFEEKADTNHADLASFYISAKTGEGFDKVLSHLEHSLKTRFSPLSDAGLTRERHRDCASRALDSIDRAISALTIAPELAGEDIRRALQAIRELAGDSDVEHVFDRIFSRFCVGK